MPRIFRKGSGLDLQAFKEEFAAVLIQIEPYQPRVLKTSLSNEDEAN